jgi:hypothetical protein
MNLTRLFRQSPARRPDRARARLRVEALESRHVLSNFTLGSLTQVSGATSPFDGCPDQLDLARNAETEPWVAVNPTDPDHLVAVWIQDFAAGLVAGVSFNAGRTWQSVVIPKLTLCSGGTAGFAVDPWVAFAPNGDLYVTSFTQDITGGGVTEAMLVNKSTDGGLTWGDPTTLAVEGAGGRIDLERATADPTNSNFVYAVWSRFNPGGNRNQTVFVRTTDSGVTWEPARVIYESGSDNASNWHQIVVRPDRTLVEFFTENLRIGGQDDFRLSLLLSADRGVTWSGPIRGPQMEPVQVTTETGQPVVTFVDPGFPPGVDVAVNRNNGHLYAVWEDSRFSNGQSNSIAFSMSTDGGLTWSEPAKINKTPASAAPGNEQAFLPSVEVAANGAVAVTYYDFRNNTPATGLPTDYWVIHAHPDTDLTNPANWENELRLTTASFDMQAAFFNEFRGGFFLGDYVGLAAAGDDFVPVWSMPHGTDLASTFFRRIRQTGGSSLLAQSIGSGSEVDLLTHAQTTPLLTAAYARWQATGVNLSSRSGTDVHIADFGGTTIGLASTRSTSFDGSDADWLNAMDGSFAELWSRNRKSPKQPKARQA